MQAIRVHKLGKLDVLRLEETPSPVPGPGQVRIAVHAAGCNFADTLMIEGIYQHKPDLPFSPGMEAAGDIIDVGPGVADLAPGDRVTAWLAYGGYAEEAVVEATSVIKIPADMDYVTAAAFPVTYSTAAVSLTHKRVDLTEGEVLLVHGAAGGVGLASVEVGKALGATVVATAGTDEKLEIATAHGADHVINYTTESIRERVKALVGGADVVLDPVGGDAFDQSLRCVNSGGRLVIIGLASGTIPQVPANYLLVKNVSAIGFSVGGYRRSNPEIITESFARMVEWYAAGKLHPTVSHTFPLAETGQALDILLKRKAIGKVVVRVR
jgi:NADPH2:quinone reductase